MTGRRLFTTQIHELRGGLTNTASPKLSHPAPETSCVGSSPRMLPDMNEGLEEGGGSTMGQGWRRKGRSRRRKRVGRSSSEVSGRRQYLVRETEETFGVLAWGGLSARTCLLPPHFSPRLWVTPHSLSHWHPPLLGRSKGTWDMQAGGLRSDPWCSRELPGSLQCS